MDYSKLSEETLQKISNNEPLDYSKLNDAELEEVSKIEATSEQPVEQGVSAPDLGKRKFNILGPTQELLESIPYQIPESIPLVGGEKLGDIYKAPRVAAESAASGMTVGLSEPVMAGVGAFGGMSEEYAKLLAAKLRGEEVDLPNVVDEFTSQYKLEAERRRQEKEQNKLANIAGGIAGAVSPIGAPTKAASMVGNLIKGGKEVKDLSLLTKMLAGGVEGTIGAGTNIAQQKGEEFIGTKTPTEGDSSSELLLGGLTGAILPGAKAVSELGPIKNITDKFNMGLKGVNIATQKGIDKIKEAIFGTVEKEGELGQFISGLGEQGKSAAIKLKTRLNELSNKGTEVASKEAKEITDEFFNSLDLSALPEGSVEKNRILNLKKYFQQQFSSEKLPINKAQTVKKYLNAPIKKFSSQMEAPVSGEEAAYTRAQGALSESINKTDDILRSTNNEIATLSDFAKTLGIKFNDETGAVTDLANLYNSMQNETIEGIANKMRNIPKAFENLRKINPELADKYQNRITELFENLAATKEVSSDDALSFLSPARYLKLGANISGQAIGQMSDFAQEMTKKSSQNIIEPTLNKLPPKIKEYAAGFSLKPIKEATSTIKPALYRGAGINAEIDSKPETPDEFSRRVYSFNNDQLNEAADKLAADPSLTHLSNKIKKAVAENDQMGKNAAQFLIAQDPRTKKILQEK